ncbi:Hypothetical predicted protein [Podarcis lilfordi]|uniref:Uncharacterized protein n=1 Tax=Podarcis lilfordi TaxID=74358 RepID=A0AA35L0J7_9SAUR|nr:Hypothetical predicted protein [Podarcis lilfordi]
MQLRMQEPEGDTGAPVLGWNSKAASPFLTPGEEEQGFSNEGTSPEVDFTL